MSPAAAGMSQELEEVQGGETQQGFGLPTSWLVLTCELELRMGIWWSQQGGALGFAWDVFGCCPQQQSCSGTRAEAVQ